jgi:hypothetical protein
MYSAMILVLALILQLYNHAFQENFMHNKRFRILYSTGGFPVLQRENRTIVISRYLKAALPFLEILPSHWFRTTERIHSISDTII